jgi:hypothetical protein
MMKLTVFLSCLICMSLHSSAQTTNDSIIIRSSFGGLQFYQNNKKLKMAELVKTMETNTLASQHLKTARTNNTFAGILSGIGGFLIGWPVGTAIAGGDPEWAMAGVGAGLVVVSIPISIKASKEAKMAIQIFNESLNRTTSVKGSEMSLNFNSSSTGLKMVFRF